MNAVAKRTPRAEYAESRFVHARLIGLAVACPYNQSNPAHCPICPIRRLPLSERYRWAMSLERAEAAQLLEVHERCLRAIERIGAHTPRRRPLHAVPPLEEATAHP